MQPATNHLTAPFKIYISGPISNPDKNVQRLNCLHAMSANLRVMQKGHHPFCPHLSLYVDRLATFIGMDIPYEKWMEYDFAFLDVCDALLYLGPSPGADRELAMAKEKDKKIFYSLDEIPAFIA